MAYTWKGELNTAILFGEQAFQKASNPADKAWAGRGLGWALCRKSETHRFVRHALPEPLGAAGMSEDCA